MTQKQSAYVIMTYKSTMKIYINDLNLEDIKGDEEEEIEWDLVKLEPKTTWYIFEEKEVSVFVLFVVCFVFVFVVLCELPGLPFGYLFMFWRATFAALDFLFVSCLFRFIYYFLCCYGRVIIVSVVFILLLARMSF